MTITKEERKRLFRIIYQIEDADLLFLMEQMSYVTHGNPKMKGIRRKLHSLYNKKAGKAWDELKEMTGLGPEDDLPV